MTAGRPNLVLGQLLLTGTVITRDELQEALRRQGSGGEPLGEILLQMGAVTPEELEHALRAQSRLRGRPGPARSFVLVVDDDPEVGALVADILEGAGFCVGVAQDEAEARAALLAADSPSPAVVVLDLGLPEDGGIELLAQLRANERTRELPVVVLTGRPDLEHDIQARGLPISAFLAKPVSARHLAEVVEASMRAAPTPASA
jgi:CheY-like chemotaxis protein